MSWDDYTDREFLHDRFEDLKDHFKQVGPMTIQINNQLSRRDAFAAAAMRGLLASGRKYPLIREQNSDRMMPLEDLVAVDSVGFADALIAELDKEKG